MVGLVGWLTARLRADRPLMLTAIFLLGVDALLIWLHVQRFLLRRLGLADHLLAADVLGLDDTAGLNVLWLGLQAVLLAMAAGLVATRRPSPAVLIAWLLTMLIAAAKIAKPHLAVGEALATGLSLHGWLGLNGHQLGKLVAEIGIGLAWIAAASLAARLATDGAGRTAAALALWLVIGLAVAGGLSDLGYMLFAGRFMGSVALFALTEGGGEMVVLSLGALGFIALARVVGRRRRKRPPAPTPRSARPALPTEPPRWYTGADPDEGDRTKIRAETGFP
jgi:hypothetical protein